MIINNEWNEIRFVKWLFENDNNDNECVWNRKSWMIIIKKKNKKQWMWKYVYILLIVLFVCMHCI